MLVVNIHKADPNVHRTISGMPLSHPKGHGQYDTALTAQEKCQKTQEISSVQSRASPEKTDMSFKRLTVAFHGVKLSYKKSLKKKKEKRKQKLLNK